ncbi:TetR/AcrR family transcriptional regulator [Leifsonia shinshuensis]
MSMMRQLEFDREQALEAAMAAFWETGYAETSIEALTAATGLQRSSLYNTFHSKHALHLEALRRYLDRTTIRCSAMVGAPSPVRAITDFVRSVIAEELEDDAGFGCMVANTALEFGGRDADVLALTADNLTILFEAIAATIRRAQNLGEVSETVEPEPAARAIVVMVQGLRVAARAVQPGEREVWLTTAAAHCLTLLRPLEESVTTTSSTTENGMEEQE